MMLMKQDEHVQTYLYLATMPGEESNFASWKNGDGLIEHQLCAKHFCRALD